MSSREANQRSLIPLIVTGMAVVVPLIFILGIVFGTQIHSNSSLTSDSISSWLSAIATVAIAFLTFILAKETWYLRAAQIDQLKELKLENIRPNIGVQLESNRVGINFINVKISNLGKGIAKKVRIHFLDAHGDEIQNNADVVVDKFRRLAIFRKEIQSIGIGQEITSYVFSLIDLSKELEGGIFQPCLNISIDFEDVEGTSYNNLFTIDFGQFEGLTELGSDPLYQISKDMKKISDNIRKVAARGHGRIAVDIYSAKDRKIEYEDEQKWIADRKKTLGILD